MKINSNMTAVIAGNYLMRSELSLQSSTERLSSGYKLNSAKDNPAGYAISNYMRSQLQALEKANNNANNGISVIETAEGAVAEIQEMVQRLNELAVRAATGTMSDNDRKAIQEEVDGLTAEIERTAKETDFNTMPLLDGTFENKGYTNNVDVKVQYYSDDTRLGKYTFNIEPVKDANGNPLLDADGYYAGYTIPQADLDAFATNATVSYFESKGFTNDKNVIVESYSSDTKLGTYTFRIEEAKDNGGNVIGYTIDPKDDGLKNLTDEEVTVTPVGSDEMLIEAKDGTQLRLRIDSNNFTAPKEVEVKLSGLGVMEDGDHIIVKANDGTELHLKVNRDAFIDKTVIPPTTPPTLLASIPPVDVDLTGIGAMRLQIGANEGQILELSIPEISLEKMGIDKLDCTTKESARQAIRKIDYALSYTNTVRAKLGAYQNRLDHAIASLDITEENLTGSYSRIVDTDMAEEMTEYTRLQVMQQAGTTMLAQANEYPQKALQLLQ